MRMNGLVVHARPILFLTFGVANSPVSIESLQLKYHVKVVFCRGRFQQLPQSQSPRKYRGLWHAWNNKSDYFSNLLAFFCCDKAELYYPQFETCSQQKKLFPVFCLLFILENPIDLILGYPSNFFVILLSVLLSFKKTDASAWEIPLKRKKSACLEKAQNELLWKNVDVLC